MARSSTTFAKGQGGRTKGARDKYPRAGRECIKRLLEAFGSDEALLTRALKAGLQAKPGVSFPYLKLVIEQHAGAPAQPMSVVTKVVHEYHDAAPGSA